MGVIVSPMLPLPRANQSIGKEPAPYNEYLDGTPAVSAHTMECPGANIRQRAPIQPLGRDSPLSSSSGRGHFDEELHFP